MRRKLFVCSLLLCPPAFAQTRDEMRNLNIDTLLALANDGNAKAQDEMGDRARSGGKGIAKSAEQAMQWYRKSAVQNYPMALYDMASLYEAGEGVPKDQTQADELYHLAFLGHKRLADAGAAEEQESVGLMYSRGKGIQQSDLQANAWFEKSADQGYASAQMSLAVAYLQGTGVPKDADKAYAWLRKAADQGDPTGEFLVGVAFQMGLSVSPDHTEAAKWFGKAIADGSEEAQRQLDLMIAADSAPPPPAPSGPPPSRAASFLNGLNAVLGAAADSMQQANQQQEAQMAAQQQRNAALLQQQALNNAAQAARQQRELANRQLAQQREDQQRQQSAPAQQTALTQQRVQPQQTIVAQQKPSQGAAQAAGESSQAEFYQNYFGGKTGAAASQVGAPLQAAPAVSATPASTFVVYDDPASTTHEPAPDSFAKPLTACVTESYISPATGQPVNTLYYHNGCSEKVSVVWKMRGDIGGADDIGPGKSAWTTYGRSQVDAAGGTRFFVCPYNYTPQLPDGRAVTLDTVSYTCKKAIWAK
jgi:hypothetical protein